jgi:hypothetical protein
MNQKFRKWDKWIEAIHQDLQGALLQRYVFWEVQDIIEDNPRIHKPSLFYSFLGNGYAALGATAIRRQVKSHKDSISLARLLEEIIGNPQVFSKSQYCSIHRGPFAEKEFEDLFGGNIGSHVDPAIVSGDLCQLRAKAQTVEDFADKQIAHFDKRVLTGNVSSPSFADLDGCLDFLEELVKKYYLGIKAICIPDMLPVPQYNWKEIFEDSWLP